MAKRVAPTFNDFLKKFPEMELPITLGEDSHHAFSQANDPLPEAMIQDFIHPLEDAIDVDGMTEYVACFALPKTAAYRAIVYWKAELLNYQYRIVTFNKKGELIDQKVIAGTTYQGDEVTQSAAVIKEDRQIYIVSGQGQLSGGNYDAAGSTVNRFQLSSSGKIVEL
ncbi:MAG: hypothetical protein D6772_08490 [Bacteroidetes bacterium]|nr:MAG: hypothetical protein D6772_08490 [Bacteroidota bacterium]